MVQSIVCGACDAAVPYGRLSCPECGEMLASVAGGRQRSGGAGASANDRADVPADALHDIDGGTTSAGTRWSADLSGLGSLADEVHGPRPAASTMPVPAAPPPPAPGAYLPPILHDVPAVPMPARSWNGHDQATDQPAGAAAEVAGASRAARDPQPETDAPLLDVGKTAEFIGWLAIAGSALTIAGMLLPWSTSVIGSSGAGYFDRWGLAGPGHLIVSLAVVGVLAAAILRDRVPLWLGIGLPGLGVGALLLGLVWPYLLGPLSGQLGASAVGLGALMLIGAGVGALLLDRHAGRDPVV